MSLVGTRPILQDLEVSYVHGNSRIGSHSVLSYIDVQDQVIPDNVVLHGLKQRNGKFIVRIFGVNDNPKENRLFGRDLDELEDTLGVRFWEGNGQAHAGRSLSVIIGEKYTVNV